MHAKSHVVPVLSHWQRSFVAIRAAKPITCIGAPRVPLETPITCSLTTTARTTHRILFRSRIPDAERIYGSHAISERSTRCDFHQGWHRYCRPQPWGCGTAYPSFRPDASVQATRQATIFSSDRRLRKTHQKLFGAENPTCAPFSFGIPYPIASGPLDARRSLYGGSNAAQGSIL